MKETRAERLRRIARAALAMIGDRPDTEVARDLGRALWREDLSEAVRRSVGP